jgi:hypothetical protein
MKPIDISRRGVMTSALPALAATTASSACSANDAPILSASIVDAATFGARGDGRTDDHQAIASALRAGTIVTLRPGRYRISAPIRLRDGQALRGAGRGGWEPYDGHSAPSAIGRTEIIVDSGVAIDARDSNGVEVSGLAIRARDARQSRWAFPPGFQSGTIGIDIVGALQFEARDISFHGLETALSAVADRGPVAQMPILAEWSAHDCDVVARFVSKSATFVPVRDGRITGCIAAVHCGTVIDARYCDGLRIEHCRFFQCTANAIRVENTPFVTIVGTTMFETAEATLVMRGCAGAVLSGVQLARAGFYHPPPAVQRPAVLLEQCEDFSFDGLIERPMGRAFSIVDCCNVSISGTIATPFWSTGSLGSNDAAIFVERSAVLTINASFSGSDYWLAVYADAQSAPTLSGRIVTEPSAGVARCVGLQATPLGHIVRTAQPVLIPAGRTAQIDTLRIFVPARSVLVSRSIGLTIGQAVIQAGDVRWNVKTAEPDGGSLSLERQIVHANVTDQGAYALVPLGIHNTRPDDMVVPSGVELRLSLAIEAATR